MFLKIKFKLAMNDSKCNLNVKIEEMRMHNLIYNMLLHNTSNHASVLYVDLFSKEKILVCE